MTPAEALELALAEEVRAITLYQRLAKEHSAIRDTLTFLITEEQKHKKLIEKQIATMMR
jgi:rubrerythrin